ncbi:MAG: hypothetical protein B6D36_13560 [Planctomycetes bacterium UTPLA1]|nr:MAG: hypothetical protein B6D36_13560 [Planctomycetes bacterium UTPLA1]
MRHPLINCILPTILVLSSFYPSRFGRALGHTTATPSTSSPTSRAATTQPFDPKEYVEAINTPTLEESLGLLEPIPTIQEALQPLPDDPTASYRRRLTEKDKTRVDELEKQISELRGAAKFADAIPPAVEVASIRKRAQGADHWETTDAAKNVEMLRLFTTLPNDAQAALSEADSAGVKLAQSFAEGRFKEAKELAQLQFTLRREVLGNRHFALIEALHNVGATLLFTEEYDASEVAYRAALLLCRDFYAPDHPMTALTQASLAGPLIRKRSYEAADRLCRKALLTLRKTLGGEDPQTADLMNNYALLLSDRGDLAGGELLARGSLAITKATRGRENADFITSLNNLADPLWQQGKFDEAEQLLREALVLGRRVLGPQHELLATSLRNLGNVLQSQGRYSDAELLHQESLDIRQATGESQEGIAISLTNLASLHFELGEYDIAQALQEQSLQIRLKISGRRDKGVAVNFGDLGFVFQAKGELENAERMFSEALEVYSEVLGDRHPEVSSALNNLATLQRSEGHLADAEKSYRKALRLKQSNLPPDHPEVAMVQHNLAALLFSKDDSDSRKECESLYQAAIKNRRHAKSIDLWKSLTGYAEFLVAKKDNPLDSIPLFREAIDQVESLRLLAAGDELDRAGATRQSTMRWNPFSGLARAQLLVPVSQPSDARNHQEIGPLASLSTLERGRGRSLLDLLNRGPDDLYKLAMAKAQRMNDPSLRTMIERTRKSEMEARTILASAPRQISSLKADPSLAEKDRGRSITELYKKQEDARDAERRASRMLFEIARSELGSGGLSPMDGRKIMGSLKAGELLLAYDVGPNDTMLIALTHVGPVWSGILKWPDGRDMTEASLAPVIARAMAALSREHSAGKENAEAKPHYSTYDLFASLIPKVVFQEWIRSKRVIVIPHGPLHQLSFDALPIDSAENRRLAEMGPAIVYGPSATVVLLMRSGGESRRKPVGNLASKNNPLLVALGNPILDQHALTMRSSIDARDRDSLAVGTERNAARVFVSLTRDFGELAPLPGTGEEVLAIARLMTEQGIEESNVRVLLGFDATLTKLMAAADHPRFLHLATHGLAESGLRAHESALVLTMPPNPTSDDYGFLRLEDLLFRWGGKLEGTELVVLSACQSARGPLASGEGMVALTWGFLYAGADAVVASLWKVDDTATRLLMTRFYENLLGRFPEPNGVVSLCTPMPKVQALHEAKLWLQGLTVNHAKRLADNPSGGTRGPIGPISRPATTKPNTPNPYADPYYWAAFILVGDPD